MMDERATTKVLRSILWVCAMWVASACVWVGYVVGAFAWSVVWPNAAGADAAGIAGALALGLPMAAAVLEGVSGVEVVRWR